MTGIADESSCRNFAALIFTNQLPRLMINVPELDFVRLVFALD